MNTLAKTLYMSLSAATVTAFLFLAGFLPELAAIGLSGLATISTATASGTTAAAAWFRKASDEPGEQALWAALAIFGIIVIFAGIAVAWNGLHIAWKIAHIAAPIAAIVAVAARRNK